jgi:hypothetical protein
MKREGSGRGNWGTVTDEALAQLVSFKILYLLFWRCI